MEPGARSTATRELERRTALAAQIAAGAGVALADALERWVEDPSAYEASVRVGPDATPRAGRLMIEQARPELVLAIARALDVDLPAIAGRWIERAAKAGVPLIGGWDLRPASDGSVSASRCVKLYVNASDLSEAARRALAQDLLGTPLVEAGMAPAVLGMNIAASRSIETKLYVQRADALELAAELGPRAIDLARAVRADAADAGGVASFDLSRPNAALEPRAFFVALREPIRLELWPSVRRLPGFSSETSWSIETPAPLWPFAPAPPRSVGVAMSGPLSWTLYCKPRGSSRAPLALEPAAVFRADGAEVGVFVEPTESAARAFRRTARHAISIRVRQGAASPALLDRLGDWLALRIGAQVGLHHPGALELAALGPPPAPWVVVRPGGSS